MKIKKILSAKWVPGIWIGFVLSFLLFIWAPSEFYWSNRDDVWFSLTDILSCSIPVALSSLIVILIVLILANERGKHIIISITFSALIGFYIQGNWINANYGIMNGEEINWSNYAIYGVVDTLFWILIFIVPFVLLHYLNVKKWTNLIIGISMGVFLILVITMFTLVLTVNLNDEAKKTENLVVTNKDIFNMGEQKNVVVFIIDSLDSLLYDAVYADNKDYSDDFEDFTYYDNMTGMYPTTQASIPYIITGEEYSNQSPYYEWLEDAYKDSEIFKVLKDNNYKAGLYVPNFVAKDSSIGIIDNIENVQDSKPNDNWGLYRKWMDTVLFRYMPHYLKKNFVVYTGELDQYKSTYEYGEDDVSFFNKLTEENIKIDEGNSEFRVYHLQGAHPPYIYDENVQPNDNANQLIQTKGSLNIVKTYISMLKQKNIYDQTAIVICADHGSASWSELSQSPLVMVKGFEEHHPFATDNTAVSYSELNNTIMSLLDGNLSRDTIWDNKEEPLLQRRFLYYALEEKDRNMDYMPVMYEYWIGEEKNTLYKGSYFYNDTGAHEIEYYSIDNELKINITDDKQYLKLCDYGLQYFPVGSGGDQYRWTSGKETSFTVNFEDKTKSYKMNMNILGTLGEQSVRCLINKNVIADFSIEGNTIEIIIPKEFVQNGRTQIILQWPNAVRASEFIEGSNDSSVYAVQIKNIEFEKVN